MPIKALATVICIISVVLTLASAALTIVMGDQNYYNRPVSVVKDEMMKNMGSNYAAQILSEVDGLNDPEAEMYGDSKSFSYEVLQVPADYDIKNPEKGAEVIYKSPGFTADGYYLFEGRYTAGYSFDTTSAVAKFMGPAHWYMHNTSEVEEEYSDDLAGCYLLKEQIGGSSDFSLYYDEENGIPVIYDVYQNTRYNFISRLGDGSMDFTAEDGSTITFSAEDDAELDAYVDAYLTGEDFGAQPGADTNATSDVTVYNVTVDGENTDTDAGEISIEYLPDETVTETSSGTKTTTTVEESTDYIDEVYPVVLYKFEDSIYTDKGETILDMRLYEANRFADRLLAVTAVALPMCVIFGILFVAAAVYLAIACGRRPDGSKGNLRAIDRFPYELYLGIVVLIDSLLSYLLVEGFSFAMSRYTAGMFIFVYSVIAAFMAFLVVALVMTTIARFKAKRFLDSCLIVIIGKAIWGAVTAPMKELSGKTSVVVKVLIAEAIITILQIIVLSGNGMYGFAVFCFIVYKALEIFFVTLTSVHFSKIKDGAERLSEGILDKPVDTTGMKFFMKDFGDDINRISDGVSLVVNNQMKSERMKTELITNVSHDIKTPLTSIINYVDLLEKEDIESEKAKEYMDVISRQSIRLKKLIEDLIEASKAQSGALEVNMDKIDPGVLLTQAVGEYADKLEAANVELVLNKPEAEMHIMADGRHLFRVFANLLGNISKYAQSGTRAYVDLNVRDGKAIMEFKNISHEQLNISGDELMERFVRGDESRTTEGNGLGLSIARSLTELMKGTMDLSVDGDLFKVTLTFATE